MGGGDVNCQNTNVELDNSASRTFLHFDWPVATKAIRKLSKEVKTLSKVNQKLCRVPTVGRFTEMERQRRSEILTEFRMLLGKLGMKQ